MPAAQLLFTRFILAVLVQCWGGVRWQMGKFACPLPVMYRCTLYTVFASQGVIGHLERTLGEEFQLSLEPNTRITKKCDRRDFDREAIKDARRVWVSWKLLISGDFFCFFCTTVSGVRKEKSEKCYSGHRVPNKTKTYKQSNKKMLLGSALTDLTVACCMQMVGSEFGVNNIIPWIRPASCQGSGRMLEL